MPNFIDLTGNKYGRLLVMSRAPNHHNGARRWNCLCECGNTKIIYGSNLAQGLTKSCGCWHNEKFREIRLIPIDRRRKFGRLKVISGPIKKVSKTFYSCRCDCGNTTEVESYTLRKGFTQSCGCLQKEVVTTHGKSQSNEYKAAKAAERRAVIYCLDEHYTTADVEQKHREQNGLCFYCDKDLVISGFHREHMVPLARGGANTKDNICLSCPSCNLKKNKKTAEEFLSCKT